MCFPPECLGSGPYSILNNLNKRSPKDIYIPRICVAMTVCWMILLFFPPWFQMYISIPITNSLIEFDFIMIAVTIIGIFMAFWNKVILVRQICPLNFSAPGHSSWILIEHATFGLFYVMFRFSTRIWYRGVLRFATDCPWGVWCRGLTTCPLYIGPLFGNLVWNESRFVRLK